MFADDDERVYVARWIYPETNQDVLIGELVVGFVS